MNHEATEAKAKQMFLAKFGAEGATWEMADTQTKVNWRDNARAYLIGHEGTERDNSDLIGHAR